MGHFGHMLLHTTRDVKWASCPIALLAVHAVRGPQKGTKGHIAHACCFSNDRTSKEQLTTWLTSGHHVIRSDDLWPGWPGHHPSNCELIARGSTSLVITSYWSALCDTLHYVTCPSSPAIIYACTWATPAACHMYYIPGDVTMSSGLVMISLLGHQGLNKRHNDSHWLLL